MNIIAQNPFRILGQICNASEKELQRQISIAKRFSEVGKTIHTDYDFEFLGDFSRTVDDIEQASNQIEQAKKKLLYSLFWFVKINSIDEIAINNLKEKNIDKAIEIWDKTLKEEITNRNYSSYSNISTLYITLSTVGNQFDLDRLRAGIQLKWKLINSDNLSLFSRLVTGDILAADSIEITNRFVDELIEYLKPYIDEKANFTTKVFISLFDIFPVGIQKNVSSKFTAIPIANIESSIEKTVIKRKNDPSDSEIYGDILYKSTIKDFILLKEILSFSNLQFQMIANKLSSELTDCSIDFYNFWVNEENSDIDICECTLELLELAKKIDSNGKSADRINESIETIKSIQYQRGIEIIVFLKNIVKAFKEVKIRNSSTEAVLSRTRISINKDKVLESAKPILTEEEIRKIVNSGRDDLIKDLFDGIDEVILIHLDSYMSASFFELKKDFLLSELPMSNSIKYGFLKSQIEESIELKKADLLKINKTKFNKSELDILYFQMEEIKRYRWFRSKKRRERDILEQEQIIKIALANSEAEKERFVLRQSRKKREIEKEEQKLVDFINKNN